MAIYLDTHLLVWLYSGEKHLVSDNALELIERHELFTGEVNILELEYLHEVGRIATNALEIYNDLATTLDLKLCNNSSKTIMKSLELKWTRDPFDRIMVANCTISGLPLITKDRVIHKHCDLAKW